MFGMGKKIREKKIKRKKENRKCDDFKLSCLIEEKVKRKEGEEKKMYI